MTTVKKTPEKGAGGTMPEIKVNKVTNFAQIDGELSFEDVVEEIKSDMYKDTTLLIRKLVKEGNIAEAQKIKKTLPGFTCSGIFNGKRTGAHLDTYS